MVLDHLWRQFSFGTVPGVRKGLRPKESNWPSIREFNSPKFAYLEMEIAERQENFFRLVLIIVDIIPKHLRNLFKDSWLQNYGHPWGDNRQAGDIMKREIAKFGGTYPNPDVERNVTNGEAEKWDCSTLFFALMFSKLDLLSGESRSRINSIREVRNKCFAHSSKAEIPSDIFAQLVEDFAKIFRYFGWDEKEITSIPRIPLTTTDLILKKAELVIEKKCDDMLKAVSLVADSARDGKKFFIW